MKSHLFRVLCTIATATAAIIPVEDWSKTIEDGCRNTADFTYSFENESGQACTSCALCNELRLQQLFDPDIESFCVDCKTAENDCNTLQVTTSFTKAWIVTFFDLIS